MYNIFIFDEITMNFSLVYMSEDIGVILKMYNFYRKSYDSSYIIVSQVIQSNEELLHL